MNHPADSRLATFVLLMIIISLGAVAAYGQTTSFTYQGKLGDGGSAANGNYDFQFALFDALTGGTQQGSTQTLMNVAVTNGIFTVNIDFGAAGLFNGANRFLEISIKPASGSTYTVLAPRQPLSSTPYAIRSLNAATSASADGLSIACVACVTSSQIGSVSGSTITGPIPVGSLPGGSGNYIQNTTSQQGSADFNISGSGTAYSFNAAGQYDLGGTRVLKIVGSNLFVGPSTGDVTTGGNNNAFFGVAAGFANIAGNDNSFFGNFTGLSNCCGSNNAFFGSSAGQNNTSGAQNAFFGKSAGSANTTASSGSFFGFNAGVNNTTGRFNSFVGASAGSANTTGQDNSFFGRSAGESNTTANENSFFGSLAGQLNTTGFNNSFFGKSSGNANTAGFNNSFFGNAAGLNNTTGTSNSFFGFSAGVANTIGNSNSFFGSQAGQSNTTGTRNSFFGNGAGLGNLSGITGSDNAFFGNNAGFLIRTGNQNSFFGSNAGANNDVGGGNSFFGYQAGQTNSNGAENSYFGYQAGQNNLSGGANSFFGTRAGNGNSAGYNNSFFGFDSGLRNTGSDNSLFGSEAGRENTTGQRNAFFGKYAGLNNTIADDNAFFGYAAGNLNTTGTNNSFFGKGSGIRNTTGANNSFFGFATGVIHTTGNNNSFFGGGAGGATTTGNDNSFFGFLSFGSDGINNATAIGARAAVAQSNSLVLGSIAGTNGASSSTNVGIGTAAPLARLDVRGDLFVGLSSVPDIVGAPAGNLYIANDAGDSRNSLRLDGFANTLYLVARSGSGAFDGAGIVFRTSLPGGGETDRLRIYEDGEVRIEVLGTEGATPLCRNLGKVISTCSSSLRYKTNVQPFAGGLDILNRLRPITFHWKTSGMRDVGLGAEDVAKIEPLLTFTNASGEIEGVKYDQLSVVLINAIKQQQSQIDAHRQEIQHQQIQIESLMKLVRELARRRITNHRYGFPR